MKVKEEHKKTHGEGRAKVVAGGEDRQARVDDAGDANAIRGVSRA